MYSGLSTPRTWQHLLDNFTPVGLHVLVVDDDPLCLMVLDRMLRHCNYKVTTSNRVNHALQLLREDNTDFDIVISDVYMPDDDGFKLLEVIGLELDLPVIMISANGDFSVVMRGIIHGACDYLIKPVRIEELQNIWQHVIRRKSKDFCKLEFQGENDVDARASEAQKELYRKRKEDLEISDLCIDDISSCPKRARVNWSVELHQQFVNAVNELGIEKAVPKKIMEIMNVEGLSRENVASHLQKYRLYLKRLSGVIPEPLPVASFQASDNGAPGGPMLIRAGRRSPILHSSSIASSKEQRTMDSAKADQCMLNQCESSSVDIDKLSCGSAAPIYMQGKIKEAMKDQGDPTHKVSTVDYSATPIMQALEEDLRELSRNELNNPDYGQDKIQPLETATREVAASMDLMIDDTDNSTKQSYEVSTASTMATEMCGETFSDSSIGALINDLDIVPHTQQHIMERVNSELLDVDEYLQLDEVG